MEEQSQQKRSNQYIKRKERAQSTEFARRKIKAGILISRLNKAAAGKIGMSRSQLDATKLLLDKALPSLQAVEHVQEAEMPTEAEIMAQLHSLLANPGTRAQIQAMLAGSPKPVTDVAQEQQSHCTTDESAQNAA